MKFYYFSLVIFYIALYLMRLKVKQIFLVKIMFLIFELLNSDHR